ncbi:MAG: hypothetical protein M0Z94_06300, partial [Dehalococcoidales bacterium]|nr:hypothetical protein [Dehalococcoidales bacterium]
MAAAMLILFASTLYVYYHAAQTIPRNADNASIALEGQDLLAGNWNLSGWSLPPDTFWLTDIPFYALGARLFGLGPFLMDAVPAFIHGLAVACTVWLALRPYRGWAAIVAGASSFALAGIPSAQTGTPLVLYVLMGPIHMGTILAALLALGLLESSLSRLLAKPRPSRPGTVLMIGLGVLLMAMSVAGDPFAVWVFLLPMAVGGVILLLRDEDWRRGVLTLGLVAVSFAVAQCALYAVATSGGFYANKVDAVFVPFATLTQNLKVAVQGLLCIFGADFFGQRFTKLETLLLLGHAALLCFVLFAVWRALGGRSTDGKTHDWLATVLAVAFVVDFAAYALSTNASSLGMNRYLLPLPFVGAVLGGRMLAAWFQSSNRDRYKASILVGLAVALVCTSLSFRPILERNVASLPERDLGNWLAAQGLYHGFGPFWDASIVTVASKGTVAVRPLIADDNYLAPFRWHSTQA